MFELGKFIKIRIKVEVSLISLLFNYDINMSWLGGETKTNFRPVLCHTWIKNQYFSFYQSIFFNTIMFYLVFFNSTDTYLYFHLNA